MGIFYHKDSTDYFVVVELGMSLHILLDLDMRPKKVQERSGHSSIAITMDTYSHILQSIQYDVARRLDDMFEE